VGIFSGWRRVDVGCKTWVEPGEEQRSFENRGKSPRAPKKGQKIFKILNFENEIFRNSSVPP